MAEICSSQSTPLYQRVQAAIAEMIHSHRLQPGEVLPSEKDLEAKYGVSRITIRRALDELERAGQVIRSKGKPARVAQPLMAHGRTHIEDDFITMMDLVRGTVPEILKFEWMLPDDALYERLELSAVEPVLRVDRIRRKNGTPILHTTAHVPAFIGVRLSREELSRTSMVEIMADSGVRATRSDQFMSAAPCHESIAPLLGLQPGEPVFQVARLVRDTADRPIQSLMISCRWDSFTYRLSASLEHDESAVQVVSAAVFPSTRAQSEL